jgi:hypothetical protein
MQRILSGIVLSITILSAACGGQSSSPLSPSGIPPTPASSTTGATVVGTVRLGLTAPVVGSSADAMKVEVVGTTIVAVVSAAGQFELGNVPAGQVRLHFFGAGVDAYVTISNVTAGEPATITVTVVGTTAVLESQQRNTQGQLQQIEGRVESLPPTQPAGTLLVAGRTITTDAQTVIRQGSVTKAFADLEVGQRVHVKGTLTGTTFVASIIEIQNTQTDVPVVVNGIVSGLTGNELAFQFTVDGRLVKGDGLTQFYGNSMFDGLKNGVRVEVKGQQQDAAIYAVRIHVQSNEGDKGVSLVGTLTAKTGAVPVLTLVVGGTTVYTSAATVVERKNAVLVLSDLRVGDLLRVEGTKRADGSIDALTIEIKDTDTGTPIDLSGVISDLSGGCPQRAFLVNGTAVVTDSRTSYVKTDCAGLSNGGQVEIKGLKQPDGSVVATKITLDEGKKETAYQGKGTVGTLSGSCPSVTFTLTATSVVSTSTVTVSTNSATVFSSVRCDDLKAGLKVSVKGTQQADGKVLATKVEKG